MKISPRINQYPEPNYQNCNCSIRRRRIANILYWQFRTIPTIRNVIRSREDWMKPLERIIRSFPYWKTHQFKLFPRWCSIIPFLHSTYIFNELWASVNKRFWLLKDSNHQQDTRHNVSRGKIMFYSDKSVENYFIRRLRRCAYKIWVNYFLVTLTCCNSA